MSNNSSIKWFLRELPELEKQGLLDETAAQKLGAYYRDRIEFTPSPRYFAHALAVFGGVLMAGALILFFNYNWDSFTRFARIGIGALPLIGAFVLTIVALFWKKNQVMRELSAVATATGIAVCIGTVSRVYQTSGTVADFATLVLFCSVPFVYIFNSATLATICIFGLGLTIQNPENGMLAGFWLTMGIAPFLLFHLQSASKFSVWMRYMAMPLALFFLLVTLSFSYVRPLTLFVFGNVFLLAGWEYHHRNEGILRNPWLTCAFLGMLLLLGVASSSEWFWTFKFSPVRANLIYFWVSLGIMTVISVGLFLRQPLDVKRAMFAILLGLGIAGLFVAPDKMCFYTNIFIAVFGISLMFDGGRRQRVLTFNGGLLLLMVLVTCRFFDADLGLLIRSAGLFVLGLGFLGANIFFSHRIKHGEA